jgi:hypothetical protein
LSGFESIDKLLIFVVIISQQQRDQSGTIIRETQAERWITGYATLHAGAYNGI